MTTGRVSFTIRKRRKLVHLKGRGSRTRCGKAPPLRGPAFAMVENEEAGVTCRMCLRCIDTDAGKVLTR